MTSVWRVLLLASLLLGSSLSFVCFLFLVSAVSGLTCMGRVAMIANDANINEHTDPKLVIAGLRQQIDMLKAELRSSGKEPDEPDVPLSVDDLAMYALFSIPTKVVS